MNEDAESLLCTSCGLCCTGALHDTARVYPDEVDHVRALGLELVFGAMGAPIGFALPCPKLDGTYCTIYTERPRTCGVFACRLLEQVRTSEKPLDEALALVREARSLAADATATFGSGDSFPKARAELDQAGFRRSPERSLRMAAFTHFLDRHFRKVSEGPILAMETLATTSMKE